ncbi:MAG: TorF family putative porin [Verrucomicrobia bacterium]|nr:TorF family putative porin [Verrucomicrobiota bacterium]
MKKLLIIAATIAALSSVNAETNMSAAIGYDSAYIFRGFKLADESMTVSIDMEFDDAYLGMWTNQPIVRGFDNEFDFYGGMGFEIAEGISMDVGGTLYYYPESGHNTETFELYAGFAFDSELTPAVYFYYDLDLEAFTMQGSIGESFEVDDNSTIDVAAFYGYVDGDMFSYSYYGVSADVVYSLSDTSAASIGVRYSDGSSGPEDEVYFGASISTGF